MHFQGKKKKHLIWIPLIIRNNLTYIKIVINDNFLSLDRNLTSPFSSNQKKNEK
jgi:hypothetical protein